MRDVVHDGRGGALTLAGLLNLQLVQLYLHTMTNGVLLGGVLEKLG
jgi:hypothetical protein